MRRGTRTRRRCSPAASSRRARAYGSAVADRRRCLANHATTTTDASTAARITNGLRDRRGLDAAPGSTAPARAIALSGMSSRASKATPARSWALSRPVDQASVTIPPTSPARSLTRSVTAWTSTVGRVGVFMVDLLSGPWRRAASGRPRRARRLRSRGGAPIRPLSSILRRRRVTAAGTGVGIEHPRQRGADRHGEQQLLHGPGTPGGSHQPSDDGSRWPRRRGQAAGPHVPAASRSAWCAAATSGWARRRTLSELSP